jgi:hypothetical protein
MMVSSARPAMKRNPWRSSQPRSRVSKNPWASSAEPDPEYSQPAEVVAQLAEKAAARLFG